MAYNTVYVWAAFETLGSTNLNSNFANLGYLKTKADRAIWPCKVFFPGQSVLTGTMLYSLVIPPEMAGYDLSNVSAYVWTVSSSGTVQVRVKNETQGVQMLSTDLTIDANENDSSTAATPVVIDTANDDVAAFDWLTINLPGAGTGTAGLMVFLTFYLA